MPTEKAKRVSALGQFAMGIDKVKVIFRIGGHTPPRKGAEFAYWMSSETYGSIPLGVDAYVDDYRKYGEVVEAQNTDIYDIEEK